MNGKLWRYLATIAAAGCGRSRGGAGRRTRGEQPYGGAEAQPVPAGRVSIRRGDSVTWAVARGRTMHNVVGHGFQSRVMTHGSFTVRFTRSGT